MKIIEAMKKIKDLQIKAEDLRNKVGVYHADVDFENPVYADQRGQVSEWLQAHSDILKEILRLRVAIQRTNLVTNVAIELGGKAVTKTIAEWIHRRRDLAGLDMAAWQKLNDKGLRDGQMKTTLGDVRDVHVRRYYDPKERDAKIDLYRTEPMAIDGTLEVVNAVTDVIE